MLKKKNSLHFLITLILLLSTAIRIHAQEKQIVVTESLQWKYAVTLFESKDYETAAFEFKRFLHFFPESENKDAADFYLARALLGSEKYQEAAEIFNRIILRGIDDEMTRESVIHQSDCFRNMGNTGYAQLVLYNYLKLTDDINTIDRIYAKLTEYKLDDARKAKQGALPQALAYVSKISDENSDAYQKQAYTDLINKAIDAPKKNPTLAGGLAVLPGAGFFYCERYKDALVSFLLNAGLIFAAFEAWDNDNKALAGVLGFVGTGFYAGNIYGSVSAAHKYNQSQILNILNSDIQIQPGLDPDGNGISLLFNYKF